MPFSRSRRSLHALLGVVLLLALAGPAAVAPEPATAAGVVTRSVLERGDRGKDVKALQRALRVRADGVYGKRTRRAVRRFQRREGLQVDGIAGPATMAALGLTVRPRRASLKGDVRATLERIAECESGGNPRAVSPDGRYRGKYQFSRATWRAMGGTGDPAKAPEAEQDRRAAKLLAERGTRPWPACG